MNLRSVTKTILDGKELSDEEKEHLVKTIDRYWDEHPDVINRFPRWRKYIAWVAGYQLFDYNKISKKIVEVPLSRTHKLIFNRLRPYVRTVHSKLAADVPQMGIIPNTNEDSDVRAAQAGDKVISGLAEKIHFTNTLNDVKLWTIICNRAFFRVLWDESASGLVGYEEEKLSSEEEESAPEGEATGSGTAEVTPTETSTGKLKPVYEDGDIRIESIPPFNCRTDPLYYDRKKWRWFLYGEETDAEEVEEEYDLASNSLQEKSTALEQAYNLDLQDEQDIIIGTPEKRQDISGRTVIWKELWTPQVYVFSAGGKILDYGINEYNEIPFYDVEERMIPIDTYQKEFQYNESMIKDVIPLQREYNRMASIMSIALDRASKLKVLAPLGSILSKKQWVNDYGVFIDYNNRAGEPHQMKMDPFPMEIPQYKSDLEREMETIFSLSPASFGRLPERASHASGTLVNLLLEQDEVVLNPLLNRINDAVSDAWTLAMKLVQDNYTAERLIKFVGEDGIDDVIKFKGSDLMGNTDVKVTSQTGLPRSRPLKIEYIMKLREQGLLTDDKSTLEMLQFGSADKIFKDQLLHERKAQRENNAIQVGMIQQQGQAAAMVYQLDDHDVHMKIHLRLRLGVEYDQLNDIQRAALEEHISAHMQILQARAQAMAEQAANEQMMRPGRGRPAPARSATGPSGR